MTPCRLDRFFPLRILRSHVGELEAHDCDGFKIWSMKSTTESSLCLMKAVDTISFPAKNFQDLLLSQLFGTQIFVNKTNEGGKVNLHEMHLII